MKEVDILVGEDNEAEFFFIERISKSKNPPVSCFYAKDGMQVIEYINAPDNSLPKLIILDVHMPGLDGFEVLERLKKDDRTSAIPVIMYSSSLDPDHIKLAYRLGANSYIRKPGSYNDLKILFENIIQYWLRTNQVVQQNLSFI